MAMEADILRALRSHLIAFAQDQSLPIAFTNVEFTPPADGQYLRETFLPNGTERVRLSGPRSSVWRGLYQIDVYGSQGKGQTEAVELAASIAAHFVPADRLRQGVAVVRITKHPEVFSLMVEDARIMIPVTVTWEVAG